LLAKRSTKLALKDMQIAVDTLTCPDLSGVGRNLHVVRRSVGFLSFFTRSVLMAFGN
jgi:hypothetical protein